MCNIWAAMKSSCSKRNPKLYILRYLLTDFSENQALNKQGPAPGGGSPLKGGYTCAANVGSVFADFGNSYWCDFHRFWYTCGPVFQDFLVYLWVVFLDSGTLMGQFSADNRCRLYSVFFHTESAKSISLLSVVYLLIIF